MNPTECHHCGQHFDAGEPTCPYCGTPTPARQEADFAPRKRRFIWLFVTLVALCAVMILWLPRVLRS